MKILLVALSAVSLLSAADLKLGKPLAAENPIALATLLAHSENYVGKTVQVKGKIAAVCQEMGCWLDLVNDAGQKIRIKVNDGEIEFPKDASGKTAIAEGTFNKIVLTRDQAILQAQEEAQESGRKFDPASIKSGTTYYQIQGSGAVILGN
jgi:hypothetical protein